MPLEIITPVRPLPRGVEVVPSIAALDVTPHIEGERFWVDKDGPHAIQVAAVKGLTGTLASRLRLATLAPGIPRYGQFHPVVAFLPVTLVEAAYASEGTSDIAIVTITYGFATGGTQYFTNEPGDTTETLPQLEVLSTVQPATTQFEIDPATGLKKRITVSYIVEDIVPGVSTPVTQGGSVEYPLSMETVRYMRREPHNPQAKSRQFKRHINSTGVFGDAPHYWMCTRLDGVSDDGGATFNVTYEFQRNPDTWDPYIAPTDPKTGNPRAPTAADLTLPDSARTIRILPEADFWDLNLTLPPRSPRPRGGR